MNNIEVKKSCGKYFQSSRKLMYVLVKLENLKI